MTHHNQQKIDVATLTLRRKLKRKWRQSLPKQLIVHYLMIVKQPECFPNADAPPPNSMVKQTLSNKVNSTQKTTDLLKVR